MLLYHYYDKKTGPFKNLSDLSDEEANRVLLAIKAEKPETMCAKRQDSYVADRRHFEEILRNEFRKKGGKIEREVPLEILIRHSATGLMMEKSTERNSTHMTR